MMQSTPTSNEELTSDQTIRNLKLRIDQLELKLNDTVDLLHIWKSHAYTYRLKLETLGVDIGNTDEQVMIDFLNTRSVGSS